MELLLKRDTFTEESTIGKMYVDGPFYCYTLEDTTREEGVKVDGKTAIPCGRYRIIINQSARFKRAMPLLLNVPQFEGIRIHPLNTASQTEGCIGVGFTKKEDFIGESKLAFNQFFDKLYMALRNEECWITIEREVA
jgi:hypothetical protein